jgi:hypothetical protein
MKTTMTNHGAAIPLVPVEPEYYYLKEGDVIEKGDEFLTVLGEWKPTQCTKELVCSIWVGHYRRRTHNNVMESVIPELRFSEWAESLKGKGYGRVTGVYPMKKIILFTTVSEQEERVYVYDRITTETKQVA